MELRFMEHTDISFHNFSVLIQIIEKMNGGAVLGIDQGY